jgi:gamma-glutamylcyclotransferase (GGCT)/AIG2-like uncharacterized protein YtfP
MRSESTELFVYGTLQRGGSNHGQLAGQRFVGEAWTEPIYRLYQLDGYPGMVVDDGIQGHSIPGEIWSVDAACLARLDKFEGIDEWLYARIPILLAAPHESRPVMTYVYLRSLRGLTELARWGAAGGEPR